MLCTIVYFVIDCVISYWLGLGGAINTAVEEEPHFINQSVTLVFVDQPLAKPQGLLNRLTIRYVYQAGGGSVIIWANL